MSKRILFVEDEKALRTTLGDRLRREGYIVDFAADGDDGFEKAISSPFDLIILDIMLPRRNGLDVCRELRSAGTTTPILVLTARTQTVDKIVGLNLGADDYVTKPFDSMELVARVEALLRRPPMQAARIHYFGSISVDVQHSTVTRDGKPVSLSAREFQLLRYFIDRAGMTLSREEILQAVWGYDADTFTRTVDMHVAILRQKLEANPKEPELILTVHRAGYKFHKP
jgi:two-component system, OmpR family, alkaline phosphatase synthesis response regulator PhoP